MTVMEKERNGGQSNAALELISEKVQSSARTGDSLRPKSRKSLPIDDIVTFGGNGEKGNFVKGKVCPSFGSGK